MEETSSRECALIAARAADERKATDIMVIKVGDLVDVTDYFVIATGANTPQVEAILDNIEEKVRIEGGVKPISRPNLVIFIVWKPCGVTPLLSISPKRASSIPNTASVLLSWLGT